VDVAGAAQCTGAGVLVVSTILLDVTLVDPDGRNLGCKSHSRIAEQRPMPRRVVTVG
jgi:hypothetical protein